MTIHQCPKCELRFNWKTELDDHCWHDHPEFRHDYPASVAPVPVVDAAAQPAESVPSLRTRRRLAEQLLEGLVPRHPREQHRAHHLPSEPGTTQGDG